MMPFQVRADEELPCTKMTARPWPSLCVNAICWPSTVTRCSPTRSQVQAGAGFEPGDGDAAGGGGHRQHPGHEVQAGVVQDRVVDGVAAGGRDLAEVVDHLPRLQPGGADRYQEGPDGFLGDRVRVTGVEQLALDQEPGVHDQRDIPVDERVIDAVDVHRGAGDLQRVPVPHLVHPVAELAELRADRPVGPQCQLRIVGQRGAYRVRVEVIRVLVSDHHRGGAVQGRSRVGERARVDDQHGAVLVQPDARVTELREAQHETPAGRDSGRPHDTCGTRKGTHEELVACVGTYAEPFALQALPYQ